MSAPVPCDPDHTTINKKHIPQSLADFLAAYDVAQQDHFLAQCHVLSAPKHHVIFALGDKADHVYFIQSGSVISSTINEDGKETFFRTRTAGDFFGYYGVLGGGLRSAAMKAAEDTVLWVMPAAIFVHLVTHAPDNARAMLYRLTDLLQIETDRLSQIAGHVSPERRLMLTILDHAVYKSATEFTLPTITELASYMGMARETASRLVSNWQKSGLLVKSDEGWCIPDITSFIETSNH